MELEELNHHWQNSRAIHEQNGLSDEELSALLPAERTVPFWQVLYKTSHYVGIYGFLFFCCRGC